VTVRWGIAGCSRISEVRLVPAIRQAEDAELVAVSSHDLSRAREFAERNGIPRGYGCFTELAADEGVDAIYIGGVNEVHAEQTIAAARAGKHVLCEKPMALTLDDARVMIDACNAAGVVLGINHHLRAAAPHRRMRAEIEAGSIGTPLAARVSFPVFLGTERRTWRLDDTRSGGVLFDIGSHVADLLRYLLATELRRVSCFVARQSFIGVAGSAEDVAAGAFEAANGCLGVLYVAYNAPQGRMGVEVQGTGGNLFARGTLGQVPSGSVYLADDQGERELPLEHVDLYEQHVLAFGDALRGHGRPIASGEDGFRSLEAALALRRAAQDGVVVELGAPIH
jgi:1,5-anhydro-D-fructose reductase (1,5-anhydro-D-mannitol-forming)